PSGWTFWILAVPTFVPIIAGASIGVVIRSRPRLHREIVVDETQEEAGRLVLRPGRVKWLSILVLSGAFVAIGYLMVRTGGPMRDVPFGDARFWGWAVISFFGLGFVISMATLLSPHFNLTLSPLGFTFGTVLGTRSYEWTDVHSFRVELLAETWPFPPLKQVRFTRRRETSSASPRVDRGGLRRRADGALPYTYGIDAEKLAATLNRWQQRNAP